MKTLTVIVPAYGCAKYLPKCLASLDAQTFRDFETLLAVEDSPDDSLAICRASTEAQVLSGSAAFDWLYVQPATCGMYWTCWRFVHRRAAALPRFRPGVIHEDVDVLPRYVRGLGKVAIVDERLYRYTEAREGAATQIVTPRSVRDMLEVTAHNFGCGFDAMLSYNLWGFYKATRTFAAPERDELLAEFRRHREWLAAVALPQRTAWLKRLYARFFI